MRAFFAINFDQAVKAALTGAIEALRAQAEAGGYTRPENLHLTLAFIGETRRVRALEEALRAVGGEAFSVTLSGFGRFRRPDGDICWIGVRESPELASLHNTLCAQLLERGFHMEARPFRPHLTLGRRVVLPRGFDDRAFGASLPDIAVDVGRIGLMKSERVSGRLIYTETAYKNLD